MNLPDEIERIKAIATEQGKQNKYFDICPLKVIALCEEVLRLRKIERAWKAGKTYIPGPEEKP